MKRILIGRIVILAVVGLRKVECFNVSPTIRSSCFTTVMTTTTTTTFRSQSNFSRRKKSEPECHNFSHWRSYGWLFDMAEGNNNSIISHLIDSADRPMWRKTAVQALSFVLAGSILAVISRPAWATSKSRTDGYGIQKTDDEWKAQLSPMQYYVLRQGGTERPGFSILEQEKRPGVYVCAGCKTPLFETSSKFKSGTGWPSFARGLDGVEIESVGFLTANLSGAEIRCKTCGGHLGDVFNDGMLFQGTEAAITGKRFCVDGAALVFYPEGEEVVNFVRGDIPANLKGNELPSIFDLPKITPRELE